MYMQEESLEHKIEFKQTKRKEKTENKGNRRTLKKIMNIRKKLIEL